jgi:putative copper export protein
VTGLVVVWLHVTAATVWVGTLLGVGHLIVPALARGGRAPEPVLDRRRLSWTAVAVVVVTGFENLRRFGLTSGWLALKLLLVLALFAVAAHRDFALVPRARAAIAAGTPPAAALAGVRWLDRLLALGALAVLFLAVGVARGR